MKILTTILPVLLTSCVSVEPKPKVVPIVPLRLPSTPGCTSKFEPPDNVLILDEQGKVTGVGTVMKVLPDKKYVILTLRHGVRRNIIPEDRLK